MSRSKDRFLELTGGFRISETQDEFVARLDQIERLEREVLNPKLTMIERERVQRQLCELRGEYWDGEDEWELGGSEG